MTVTDTLEPGLTLNGPVTGTGWACGTSGATITCTRSDPLAAGSDYPPISIPVLVSADAQPGQLSNTASLQAPSLATATPTTIRSPTPELSASRRSTCTSRRS